MSADVEPAAAEPAAAEPAAPPKPRTHDLTTGPIGRTLLLFALPALGSNILQSLNGSINAAWVGNFLGEDALAATSNANLVLFLMFAGVFGFGMAATILVGQATGRRDTDAMRRAMGTAVGLFIVASAIVATLGGALSPAILRLLATPGPAQGLASTYLRIVFVGMPASFMTTLLMMGLRGTGDSVTPFWFMGLSVVLDAGLNPFLIRGIGPFPAMGIAGSATATAIASYLSLALFVATIYLRDLPIRLKGRELRYLVPDPALLRVVVAKGLPMGLQMLVASLSALAMIGLVNRRGVVVTAGYGVVQQLWAYIQMPALAIGAAVSAMAAQNIGAGKWDRLAQITRAGIVGNVAVTGVAVVLLTLADRWLLAIFLGADSPAIPIAQHIQLVVGWSFVLFGITMILFGTVRANGAVVAPLVILVIALFPIRLGFALLALPHLGADALWWSFPVGSLASVSLASLYYLSGRWRRSGMAPQR